MNFFFPSLDWGWDELPQSFFLWKLESFRSKTTRFVNALSTKTKTFDDFGFVREKNEDGKFSIDAHSPSIFFLLHTKAFPARRFWRKRHFNTDFCDHPRVNRLPLSLLASNMLLFHRKAMKILEICGFQLFSTSLLRSVSVFSQTESCADARSSPVQRKHTLPVLDENSMIFPQTLVCVGEWKCNFPPEMEMEIFLLRSGVG